MNNLQAEEASRNQGFYIITLPGVKGEETPILSINGQLWSMTKDSILSIEGWSPEAVFHGPFRPTP